MTITEGGAISLHCPPLPGEPWWTKCGPQPPTTAPPSSTTVTYATSTVKVTTTTASTASQPSSTTGAPTTLSSSPTTIVSVATTVCQEDEACWDCHTMGNHICGTSSTSPVDSAYHAPLPVCPASDNSPWCKTECYNAAGQYICSTATSTTQSVVTQPAKLPVTGSPTPAEAGVGAAFFGVGAVLLLAVGLSKVRRRWNS
jgi:hypothetical protein